jgi:hypothetical protein
MVTREPWLRPLGTVFGLSELGLWGLDLPPIPPFTRKKSGLLKKFLEILIKLPKKLLLFACSRTSYTEPIDGKGR